MRVKAPINAISLSEEYHPPTKILLPLIDVFSIMLIKITI